MANVREIRQKIKSVKNIQKITKAMEMVSAAKLRKVQGQTLAIRPYAEKISDMMSSLAAEVGELDYPLFQPRPEIRTQGIVVISADKGLCGSYNANLLRLFERTLASTDCDTRIIAVGKKSVDYLRKNEIEAAATHINIGTEPSHTLVRDWSRQLVNEYLDETVDAWDIVYTEFVNAVTFKPTRVRFLPVESTGIEEEAAEKRAKKEEEEKLAEGTSVGYEFEPDPGRILDSLIPRYIDVRFRSILLEAMCSEHAARMNAMKNATDNAKDLIESLTLTYNKARQGAITKELLDIVGGAEALRG